MIHAASNNGIGLQHNITHDCAPTDCSMHKLDHGRSHPGLIAQFDSQFSTSSLIHTSLACWAQWGDQWTDIPMFYLKHTQKCLAPTPLSRLICNCGTKIDPLPHTRVSTLFQQRLATIKITQRATPPTISNPGRLLGLDFSTAKWCTSISNSILCV